LVGQVVNIDFQGDITVDPAVSGMHHTVWNVINTNEPWMGLFTGADTLEGVFSGCVCTGIGSCLGGCISYNSWSGTFTATR
jgi:hypothetical protein